MARRLKAIHGVCFNYEECEHLRESRTCLFIIYFHMHDIMCLIVVIHLDQISISSASVSRPTRIVEQRSGILVSNLFVSTKTTSTNYSLRTRFNFRYVFHGHIGTSHNLTYQIIIWQYHG